MIFKGKYLHICPAEKFIKGFIEFVKEHLDFQEHEFVILDRKNRRFFYKIPEYSNVYVVTSKLQAPILSLKMLKVEKIFIHGLWDPIVPFLYLQPWLYHKYYWIMWGGDFYFPEKQSKLKKKLIRKIRNFIGFIEGDFEYIVKNYEADGNWYECVVYINNVKFKNLNLSSLNGDKKVINILVGNSATETNNHFEAFKIIKEALKRYNMKKVKIYVPLSYGDKNYARKVINMGVNMFRNNFVPLTEFMSFDSYLDFLLNMDIGIFNNQRQQALGNIIILLGHGKKVYIRSDSTHWKFFHDYLGVKIYDIKKGINFKDLTKEEKLKNIKIVKDYFSKENVIKQWKRILES